MKLILCSVCMDMVQVPMTRDHDPIYCFCEQSWGSYVSDREAVYGGKAIPIAIDNKTLFNALKNRPDFGKGAPFISFVVPKNNLDFYEEGGAPVCQMCGGNDPNCPKCKKNREVKSHA